MKEYLYLRTPGHDRRRGFRIYRRGVGVVRDARIDSINALMAGGGLTTAQAHARAREVLEQLRALDKPTSEAELGANVALTQRYFRERYGNAPISPRWKKSVQANLARIVTMLGPREFLSLTRDELQGFINAQPAAAHEKLVLYVNSLLAFVGRGTEHVKRPPRLPPPVRYLTKKEFARVLQHTPGWARDVLVVAFTTGARLGEVFALRPAPGRGRSQEVWIEAQLYRDGSVGLTKNRKSRWATVMRWGWGAVEAWLVRPEEGRQTLRRRAWNEVVSAACRAAFPGRPDKHLNFHDLRHCYVIYWLDAGADPYQVARSIGDSLPVMLKHYAPWVQTDEGAARMKKVERG